MVQIPSRASLGELSLSLSQSLCRDCNFKGADLKGASFFDGDLTQACNRVCVRVRACV